MLSPVPLLLALATLPPFRRVCVFVIRSIAPRASLRLEFSPAATADKAVHAYVCPVRDRRSRHFVATDQR